MARFTILASGSSGNASLLEYQNFGLLIDCGLGPQVLTERLGLVGRTWDQVSAVILTHTHSDHWNGLTLAHLRRKNIPLYAHPLHHDFLKASPSYEPLHRAKLTRNFLAQELLELGGLKCQPIPVPHDSDPTFGFRLEPKENLFGAAWSLGYASDVGHITPELLEGFSGVDTLAIEFNHDVRMQTTSNRPKLLIERVLGPLGHLSNVDAAEFSRAIAESAGDGCFRHLIQLHLSKDCNTPTHALRAARHVWFNDPPCKIITASQFTPTETLNLEGLTPSKPRTTRPAKLRKTVQPTLPGFGPDE